MTTHRWQGAQWPLAANNDPGVEAAGVTHFYDYVHFPSGDGPVWLEVTYDDAGNRIEQWYYRDSNGATQMTTGNQVGQNVTAQMVQPKGTFHMDVDAVTGAADVVTATADILTAAIAAGAVVNWFDAAGAPQSRPVAAGDYVVRVDYDLKHVGGHGDNAGTQVTATASDATYTDGAGVTDVDPGGSRESGAVTDGSGNCLPTNFVEANTKAGSVGVFGVDIAGPLIAV